jgi:hypothetical protein
MFSILLPAVLFDMGEMGLQLQKRDYFNRIEG